MKEKIHIPRGRVKIEMEGERTTGVIEFDFTGDIYMKPVMMEPPKREIELAPGIYSIESDTYLHSEVQLEGKTLEGSSIKMYAGSNRTACDTQEETQ